MHAQSNDDILGIVTKASPHASVAETLERLQETVYEKGLYEFALIDHSGAAERDSLEMQEAKVLVFSSPKAGIPLMGASPLLALDLPLKALIWRDPGGLYLMNRPAYAVGATCLWSHVPCLGP